MYTYTYTHTHTHTHTSQLNVGKHLTLILWTLDMFTLLLVEVDKGGPSTHTSMSFLSYLLCQFSVDKHCLLNSLNMDSSGMIPEPRDITETTISPKTFTARITDLVPRLNNFVLMYEVRCGVHRLTFQARQDFSHKFLTWRQGVNACAWKKKKKNSSPLPGVEQVYYNTARCAASQSVLNNSDLAH